MPEKFTYEKRLGMVNLKEQTKLGGSPGVFLDGKYWCTKGGIICVIPDQWEDSKQMVDFPYESLPEGVTKAKGAYDEVITF